MGPVFRREISSDHAEFWEGSQKWLADEIAKSCPTPANFRTGQNVEVNSEGQWYPATFKSRQGGEVVVDPDNGTAFIQVPYVYVVDYHGRDCQVPIDTVRHKTRAWRPEADHPETVPSPAEVFLRNKGFIRNDKKAPSGPRKNWQLRRLAEDTFQTTDVVIAHALFFMCLMVVHLVCRRFQNKTKH